MLKGLLVLCVSAALCAAEVAAQEAHPQERRHVPLGEIKQSPPSDQGVTRGGIASPCVVDYEQTGGSQPMYEQGNRDYARGNYAAALESYRRAARLWHSGAACRLGYMYENGIGVQRDLNKAYQYYSKATESSQQPNANVAEQRAVNELVRGGYQPITWLFGLPGLGQSFHTNMIIFRKSTVMIPVAEVEISLVGYPPPIIVMVPIGTPLEEDRRDLLHKETNMIELSHPPYVVWTEGDQRLSPAKEQALKNYLQSIYSKSSRTTYGYRDSWCCCEADESPMACFRRCNTSVLPCK